MNFDFLCDNLLLIVPSQSKNQIIKEISKQKHFFSIKVMSEKELQEVLLFSYDYKTVEALYLKLHLKPSIVLEYLNAMYEVDDCIYQSSKLNQIVALKKELIQNGLLSFSRYFLDFCQTKVIKVYGFDVLSKQFLKLLSLFKKDVEIIQNKEKQKIFKITHYKTLDEEVDSICYQISSLLHQGININKIKLANVSNADLFTLKKYFKMYHLPLQITSNESLFHLRCVKDFYFTCLREHSFQVALDEFLTKYPSELSIYHSLFNISNELYFLNLETSSEILLYILKNKKIEEVSLTNAIETISLKNRMIQDEIVFVLNVVQNVYPKSFKDDDFLSDAERCELKIDTSDDLNQLEKEAFSVLLSKSEQIHLSYINQTPFQTFNKSYILDTLNIQEVSFKKDRQISYSQEVDKLDLAKIYDRIYEKNEDIQINLLHANYDVDYQTYQHDYQAIPANKIQDFIHSNNIVLSFTAIDNYFKCGFKYYLENLLKVKLMEDDKHTSIGNFYHLIFEKSFQKDFDYDKFFDEEIVKVDDFLTKIYILRNKEIGRDILKLNHQRFLEGQLKTIETEKPFKIELVKPFSIPFVGKVDLILSTKEEDQTYVAVIDYKTYGKGNSKYEKSKQDFSNGLDLQLPVYAYLIDNSKGYKNVKFCGVYYQQIIPSTLSYQNDYMEQIIKSSMLRGFSNSSLKTLSMFDPHYSNSSLIYSMKIKKDGDFSSFACVINDEQFQEMIEIAKKKITEAAKGICSGDFKINPKISQGKNISCEKCPYQEICYYTHNDLVKLDDNQSKEDEEDGD